MRTRFTWVVAILALVAIGFLMACNTKYNSSYNGLVVVPSQGGGGSVIANQGGPVMETFSLDLGNGSVAQINNAAGPPTIGLPTSVILDPAGTFAYVIIYANPEVPVSVTGIQVFQIAPDGQLSTIRTQVLQNTSIVVGGSTESVPVAPVALAIDSAGKFLFVADSATGDSSGNPVPGSISVLAIGSNGGLTELPAPTATTVGSPFPLPDEPGGSNPSASALAVTRTVFPPQYSYCSPNSPPTAEDLYVTDSANYALLNYKVDLSSGTLTLVPYTVPIPGIPTGTVPSGVAIDPCNRFAYVANASPDNTISAYTICSTMNLLVQPPCTYADFSLHPINGSPYTIPSPADNPGPMAVDAYGNFLYVVDTGSSVAGEISAFRISPSNGTLISIGNTATGSGPNSIAIRSDDSFLFVANLNSASVSQYAIQLANGELTPQTPITTFNYPSGVAVK